MCGILGINYKSDYDFKEATKIMDKRGPDNCSIKKIKNNYFGHTRLKIVDLNESANQPMQFEDILISFNGEIYNYQDLVKDENLICKTKSDTEVILRLYIKYQERLLDKIHGEFSFCIYDIKKDKYFLARDRYGKKPLYFYNKDNKFIFSSMITPIIKLLGFTPKLNKVALSQYLQYFVPLSPNTFYTDIKKLESSTYMIYENNTLYTKKYYKIETKKTIFEEKLALSKVEEVLIKSIDKRASSDVKIGTMLSGGLDSSLISSIYSKLSATQISTFSVGYETNKKHCELKYSNIVAKYLNTNHTSIVLKEEDYLSSIDEVHNSLEEPHADSASIPLHHLSKAIHDNSIKAVLSGEGADELFLGYEAYSKNLAFYEFKNTLDSSQIEFIKKNIVSSLPSSTKEIDYFKRIISNKPIYKSFGEIFNEEQKSKLFKSTPIFKYEKEKNNPIDWMSYIDMKVWLGEVLLSKVDKISMSNSVEVRNPFLDTNMVNLSFNIDNSLKLGNTNKYLLKTIAKKYLPSEIINRKKKGFNSPYNEWILGYYKDNILNTILKANQEHNLFDIEYIKYIYTQAKQNKHKQHLYALWTFSKWYIKTYI
ncbi:MAG TPA: asparagine synthase (glutamine-hydrolyzing) [Arcobacter sp.]|nr:asparagine synthase (glutamine-hydrolyzing) [Arcobacter sp.]HIP56326.1 asparagine synthase (glutamine-hydrolyzing) [Arcobacter sp.]